MSKRIQEIATLTCPKCHKLQSVKMPTGACQHFYKQSFSACLQLADKCQSCGEMLKPKEGDCCVFCSYANTKCPPKQMEVTTG